MKSNDTLLWIVLVIAFLGSVAPALLIAVEVEPQLPSWVIPLLLFDHFVGTGYLWIRTLVGFSETAGRMVCEKGTGRHVESA